MPPISDLTRNLAMNLQAIFKTGKFTCDALVVSTGLAITEINDILELRRDPTLEVLELIALALDCDPGVLLDSNPARARATFLDGDSSPNRSFH